LALGIRVCRWAVGSNLRDSTEPGIRLAQVHAAHLLRFRIFADKVQLSSGAVKARYASGKIRRVGKLQRAKCNTAQPGRKLCALSIAASTRKITPVDSMGRRNTNSKF